VDALMSDAITPEDHTANYSREISLINQLMASGRMAPIPVEWLEARRLGTL
jgi:hypothetical protein